MLTESKGETYNDKEVIVYSRKNILKRIETPTNFENLHEFKLNPCNCDISDLDMCITLRKGVRCRTQYPIYNSVAYDHLSSFFCAFVSKLSDEEIP